MIAVDATPLVLGPRRGVARALWHLLRGWEEARPYGPVRLFAPAPLPPDVPTLDGVVVRAAPTPRAFRRALPRLLSKEGATVFLSPWSAFPRTAVPVVAVVHELPFVRWGPVEGTLRALNHRRWLAKGVRECAALVVPSRATRDDVLALHPEAAPKVHVVPWGFDPAPWAHPPRVHVLEKPGADYVLLIGTGEGAAGAVKKGFDVFVRAARPEWNVVVVGAPTSAPRPEAGTMRFLASVTDDELRVLVAGARVFVYPSLTEGFGYPPLEAMAAGVPVVATRTGSIPEVLGDAALLVPPRDPEALRHAVDRAWGDAAVRERLVARGRARAGDFPTARAARSVAGVLRAVRIARGNAQATSRKTATG